MKTFIEEVVDSLGPEGEWVNTTVIFPNRRAGLFFRQALAKKCNGKAVFAPEIYSLEDFVFQQLPFQPADNLTLIGLLYKSYKKVFPKPDSFADFFFWGKMILRDFDDLDQHLADAKAVYTIVQQQKQLDLGFSFLSQEQIKVLSLFWKKFTEEPTSFKEKFIEVWTHLYPLYEDFHRHLKKERVFYKGLAYKTFVGQPHRFVENDNENFVFAGFNALTKAEEEIISFFIKNKNAQVLWDADAYYINNKAQEAGRFMRSLSSRNDFFKTFPKKFPENITSTEKTVEIIGVPFRAGQAKYVGQELQKLLEKNPNIPLHKIAVVLPDEQLLFSVLNALPPAVDKFNVTMGFPVETTPLFSLNLHCINLQEYIKPEAEKIYYRPVVQLLQHPIISQITDGAGDDYIKNILKLNRVYLPLEEVRALHPIFDFIFKSARNKFTAYLINILEQLSTFEEKLNPESVTALNFIRKQLQELHEFESELNMEHDLRNFSRFLRQLLSSDKIPFEGEPLNGLQIMGVLETRNLDFEHIFVLSLNEDFFPADSRQKSYIPYNIRKAFDLPVFDQQDAIYAYLFYRLFQRSKTVTLLYNTEGNVVGGQEMSRFVQQLIHEKPFKIDHKLLNTPVKPKKDKPIQIEKDAIVMKKLKEFLYDGETSPKRWLYPSTVFSYLFCRMQFYFKYVTGIKEPDEVDDEVDARLFGNILHDCMEEIYTELIKEKGTSVVEAGDFKKLKARVPVLIEKGFKRQFGIPIDEKFEFNGQNIVQRDILIKFVNRILDYDLQLVPFSIIALETNHNDGYEIGIPIRANNTDLRVGVKGKIDRLDEVNGSIRVIDYKTGSDELRFGQVNDIFERDTKKVNKAAFQTLFYSLLYANKHFPDKPLIPGLYSRTNLFTANSDFRLQMKGDKRQYSPIVDYRMVQEEYEEHIKALLEELFDFSIPFDQTPDSNRCVYCSYRGICQR